MSKAKPSMLWFSCCQSCKVNDSDQCEIHKEDAQFYQRNPQRRRDSILKFSSTFESQSKIARFIFVKFVVVCSLISSVTGSLTGSLTGNLTRIDAARSATGESNVAQASNLRVGRVLDNVSNDDDFAVVAGSLFGPPRIEDFSGASYDNAALTLGSLREHPVSEGDDGNKGDLVTAASAISERHVRSVRRAQSWTWSATSNSSAHNQSGSNPPVWSAPWLWSAPVAKPEVSPTALPVASNDDSPSRSPVAWIPPTKLTTPSKPPAGTDKPTQPAQPTSTTDNGNNGDNGDNDNNGNKTGVDTTIQSPSESPLAAPFATRIDSNGDSTGAPVPEVGDISTDAPTALPLLTPESTEAPVQLPTAVSVTSAPETNRPTTSPATEKPTDKPMDEPTDESTDRPSEKPTDKPTNTPVIQVDNNGDHPNPNDGAGATEEPTWESTAIVSEELSDDKRDDQTDKTDQNKDDLVNSPVSGEGEDGIAMHAITVPFDTVTLNLYLDAPAAVELDVNALELATAYHIERQSQIIETEDHGVLLVQSIDNVTVRPIGTYTQFVTKNNTVLQSYEVTGNIIYNGMEDDAAATAILINNMVATAFSSKEGVENFIAMMEISSDSNLRRVYSMYSGPTSDLVPIASAEDTNAGGMAPNSTNDELYPLTPTLPSKTGGGDALVDMQNKRSPITVAIIVACTVTGLALLTVLVMLLWKKKLDRDLLTQKLKRKMMVNSAKGTATHSASAGAVGQNEPSERTVTDTSGFLRIVGAVGATARSTTDTKLGTSRTKNTSITRSPHSSRPYNKKSLSLFDQSLMFGSSTGPTSGMLVNGAGLYNNFRSDNDDEDDLDMPSSNGDVAGDVEYGDDGNQGKSAQGCIVKTADNNPDPSEISSVYSYLESTDDLVDMIQDEAYSVGNDINSKYNADGFFDYDVDDDNATRNGAWSVTADEQLSIIASTIQSMNNQQNSYSQHLHHVQHSRGNHHNHRSNASVQDTIDNNSQPSLSSQPSQPNKDDHNSNNSNKKSRWPHPISTLVHSNMAIDSELSGLETDNESAFGGTSHRRFVVHKRGKASSSTKQSHISLPLTLKGGWFGGKQQPQVPSPPILPSQPPQSPQTPQRSIQGIPTPATAVDFDDEVSYGSSVLVSAIAAAAAASQTKVNAMSIQSLLDVNPANPANNKSDNTSAFGILSPRSTSTTSSTAKTGSTKDDTPTSSSLEGLTASSEEDDDEHDEPKPEIVRATVAERRIAATALTYGNIFKSKQKQKNAMLPKKTRTDTNNTTSTTNNNTIKDIQSSLSNVSASSNNYGSTSNLNDPYGMHSPYGVPHLLRGVNATAMGDCDPCESDIQSVADDQSMFSSSSRRISTNSINSKNNTTTTSKTSAVMSATSVPTNAASPLRSGGVVIDTSRNKYTLDTDDDLSSTAGSHSGATTGTIDQASTDKNMKQRPRTTVLSSTMMLSDVASF